MRVLICGTREAARAQRRAGNGNCSSLRDRAGLRSQPDVRGDAAIAHLSAIAAGGRTMRWCERACANLSPFAGRSATDGPCVIRNDPGGWAAGYDEGSPPPRGDGHRAPWSPKQGTELISTAILRWSQERESLWSFGRMIATSFDRTAHSAICRQRRHRSWNETGRGRGAPA